jgi:hypothetical protein
MIDRQTASGLRRPGMSALRIITGMTGDEFAAPGTPPLPSTPPVGRAGRASQPCGAGMALCDKPLGGRFQPWRGRRCRAPGVLDDVRGHRFAGAAGTAR